VELGQDARRPEVVGGPEVVAEQRRQGGGPDAGGRATKELAAGLQAKVFTNSIHGLTLLERPACSLPMGIKAS
jgi:hypothetical protein